MWRIRGSNWQLSTDWGQKKEERKGNHKYDSNTYTDIRLTSTCPSSSRKSYWEEEREHVNKKGVA